MQKGSSNPSFDYWNQQSVLVQGQKIINVGSRQLSNPKRKTEDGDTKPAPKPFKNRPPLGIATSAIAAISNPIMAAQTSLQVAVSAGVSTGANYSG
eukprot:scaffold19788_cov130-Amphora_coffeaeformis.AAC.2